MATKRQWKKGLIIGAIIGAINAILGLVITFGLCSSPEISGAILKTGIQVCDKSILRIGWMIINSVLDKAIIGAIIGFFIKGQN